MIRLLNNTSRAFAKRGILTPGKTSAFAMAALALQNLLRFKLRDSYIPQGYVDETGS